MSESKYQSCRLNQRETESERSPSASHGGQEAEFARVRSPLYPELCFWKVSESNETGFAAADNVTSWLDGVTQGVDSDDAKPTAPRLDDRDLQDNHVTQATPGFVLPLGTNVAVVSLPIGVSIHPKAYSTDAADAEPVRRSSSDCDEFGALYAYEGIEQGVRYCKVGVRAFQLPQSGNEGALKLAIRRAVCKRIASQLRACRKPPPDRVYAWCPRWYYQLLERLALLTLSIYRIRLWCGGCRTERTETFNTTLQVVAHATNFWCSFFDMHLFGRVGSEQSEGEALDQRLVLRLEMAKTWPTAPTGPRSVLTSLDRLGKLLFVQGFVSQHEQYSLVSKSGTLLGWLGGRAEIDRIWEEAEIDDTSSPSSPAGEQSSAASDDSRFVERDEHLENSDADSITSLSSTTETDPPNKLHLASNDLHEDPDNNADPLAPQRPRHEPAKQFNDLAEFFG
ncbi:hypothetical protein LTR37_010706 [Vermiconidia calcicola]|uniref:Uncharacterized protein n=1 Tax=Vermiconidia calcicola TaxID=1690605 RepID=A0ACC3N5Q5_9PEZI|nr:hypothetical protein LTR37_010706 [Vermiconidia calcicola]